MVVQFVFGVIVIVVDNGLGILVEICDVLFMLFNMFKEQGLGFGFVIFKEIFVDYGGMIVVESDEYGMCFVIGLKGV